MGRVSAISLAQEFDANGIRSTVSLIFEAGKRPDRAAFHALSNKGMEFAVSFDPAQAAISRPSADGSRGEWIELLVNGLTFDVEGLAAGPECPVPEVAHLFGLRPDFSMRDLGAITIKPGPHLAGGSLMLPVIRSQALLAAFLTALPEVRGVVWHPARTCSSPDQFRQSVLRWIEGGVFPGLCLVALDQAVDGGLQSEGLALFTGQELQIPRGLAADTTTGAKIALRLLHWLVEHGQIINHTELTGPSGELLRLEPSADQRFVKVLRG